VREGKPGFKNTRGDEIDHGFAERTTFVITKDGKVAATIGNVKPADNVMKALETVQNLAGKKPTAPTLTSSCFSLLAPDYAISQRGTYRVIDGQYQESEPGIVVSPVNAPAETRSTEAKEAAAWYADITAAVFG